MNVDEYQKLAARTLIDKPDFTLTDEETMLVWNALGLAGEAGEVLELTREVALGNCDAYTELEKELGDFLWYVFAIATKLRVVTLLVDYFIMSLHCDICNESTHTYASKMCGFAGDICDIIKKVVFHKHPNDIDAVAFLLNMCLESVDLLCRKLNINVSDVMEANIEKLKVRYPEGYTSEDSVKRADLEK